MARSLSSVLLLALLVGAAVVSAFSIDDDYYASYQKRAARTGAIDARNFGMGFGKRSAPRPAHLAGGLDRMAFGGMKFGKRSAPAAVEEDDEEETFAEAKRMDNRAFRVGFGRR